MKQNIYKRLEELERVRATDLQASADRAATQLVVEGFQAMMRQYAIAPFPSEFPGGRFRPRPLNQQPGTRGSSEAFE